LGGDIVFGEPINPEGLVGQIFLAVDRSEPARTQRLTCSPSVQPSGFTNGSEVMFARSTNGGITFSAPRRINDDPVNHAKWHWFGTLSVAPGGRIDVVWYDTRNSPNNVTSQLFYSFSIDGGNSWSPNVAVSNRLTHSLVIRISLRSAITSQSFRMAIAPTWHIQPHSMAKRIFIMSVSVQQRY
jgi:hypothetical protein